MSAVEISYKGSQIASMDATGVKTLLTGDTFCEDDIVIQYTAPSAPTPTGTKQISITQNGTTTEDVTNYASVEIEVNVSGGGATLTANISTPSIAMGAAVYYTDGDGTFHTDYVGEPMSPFEYGWYATLPVGTLVVINNGNSALPASGTNIVKKANIVNTTTQHVGAYVIEAS